VVLVSQFQFVFYTSGGNIYSQWLQDDEDGETYNEHAKSIADSNGTGFYGLMATDSGTGRTEQAFINIANVTHVIIRTKD
jgi:hypothetical protein